MSLSPASVPFRDFALAHAVRLMEEAGSLDDAGEMTSALARQTTEQGRILERARLLGARLGLLQDWARLRTALWIAAALMLLLAYALSGGLLTKALGTGQTINAAMAFMAVLAVPMLTFVVWLAWSLAGAASGGASAPWSLGQVMLGLAARMPGLHGQHSLNLLRGIHGALRDNRLGLWLFGALSHALWALAFTLMLVTLLLLFSFQSFQLTWETTILNAAFFERFLDITGWLPRLLGFVVPDTVAVHRGGAAVVNGASPSLPIALWLLACTLLYGWLPRVMALIVCAWVLFRRLGHLRVDTSDPYFRQITARFAAMAPAVVVDEEHAAPREPGRLFRTPVPGQSLPRVLLGFELPADMPWPVAELAASADQVHNIAGSMSERLQLLAELASGPPGRVLIVCSAAASPDRGAERFVRQVCGEAADCALLPWVGEPAANPGRWAAWLGASERKAVHLCDSVRDALQWIEAAPHD